MKTTEKRMYVLVPYNLSEIQKGIQAAHAIAEYVLKNSKSEKTIHWVHISKTIIILNGGTTNNEPTNFGSLQNYCKDLTKLKVNYSTFHEPDLNDALTAVAFILDMEEDSQVVGYLKQMGLA